jgi:hypothetical protein
MLAYLDAGTGSMIAGAVAAGAAGVATVGRMAWYKVSPKKKKAQEAADAAATDPADDEATDEATADADADTSS